jgi:hypothetical protein
MPRPPTNLHQKVREVLGHSDPLPPEASSPIRHFERAANAAMSMLTYVDDHLVAAGVYERVKDRHLANLQRMALASLVESFERFLKELAVLCIDSLVHFVSDDRFDDFSAKGGQIAFHLSAGSPGKALCESDTWLTNKTTNDRFKRLLKYPFGDNWENVFPEEKQPPAAERERAKTLSVLWQVRHTISHNVGVVTGSDAAKFKMIVKSNVDSNRILTPTNDDIKYVKRFLSETAQSVNRRIGTRLADVLTVLHSDSPVLFDSLDRASAISRELAFSVTIDGSVGVL